MGTDKNIQISSHDFLTFHLPWSPVLMNPCFTIEGLLSQGFVKLGLEKIARKNALPCTWNSPCKNDATNGRFAT